MDRLQDGPAPVTVVDRCPSTNTELGRRLARGRIADLEVLATEHQTAGLGRAGRSFVTPARAALTFSVALTPAGPASPTWGWVPLLMGLAAVRATAEVAGLDVKLKWPNDVLVTADPHPGKLAGVLAAAFPAGLVVGMGLNVSQTATELPVPTATSLALAGAGGVDRTVLLTTVLTRFGDLVGRWRAAAGDATAAGLVDELTRVLDTIGRRVRVELPGGGGFDGTAEALAPGGELLVRSAAGGWRTVAAGDVHHLRAA